LSTARGCVSSSRRSRARRTRETLAGSGRHALPPPELARDGLDLYGFNAGERLEGVDDLRSHLEQIHAHRIREEQSDPNVAAVLLDVVYEAHLDDVEV
jgi:hypothetical protein